MPTQCYLSEAEKQKLDAATKDVFTGRLQAKKDRKRPYGKKKITNEQLLSLCIKTEKQRINDSTVSYDINNLGCSEVKVVKKILIKNIGDEDEKFIKRYMCARKLSKSMAIKELLLNSNPYLTK